MPVCMIVSLYFALKRKIHKKAAGSGAQRRLETAAKQLKRLPDGGVGLLVRERPVCGAEYERKGNAFFALRHLAARVYVEQLHGLQQITGALAYGVHELLHGDGAVADQRHVAGDGGGSGRAGCKAGRARADPKAR